MPNRILKESITTSESINGLSYEAECLFYRLIVNCDDYGRMDGRTAIILARCFPLRIGKIKDADLKKWLDELVRGDFIIMYRNGHEYIQVKKWDDHQQVRSRRSKYPAPTDDGIHLISDDINGNGTKSSDMVCARNPIQSESNPNPNPNPSSTLFDSFWLAYPKKSAKQDAKKAWARLKVDEELFAAIMDGLNRAIPSRQWCESNGKYIPNPATFLNGARWEDEYEQYYKPKQQSFAMNKLEMMAREAAEHDTQGNHSPGDNGDSGVSCGTG